MAPSSSSPSFPSAPSSTPLAREAGAIATSVFTREGASKATQFAKDSAAELRQNISDGDFSIRFFALLGGIAIMINAVMGFIAKIISFKFVGSVIEIYVFLIGIAVIVLENKTFPLPRSLEQSLFKYCLFLKYVWGRGCLYFIAGTLTISTDGMISLIIGAFMVFVGLTYVYVGRQASRKLAAMRNSKYSDSTLQAEFAEADVGRTGLLNIAQFKILTSNLNMDLNRRELEAAFMQIDADANGTVEFQQFLAWWRGYDDVSNQIV